MDLQDRAIRRFRRHLTALFVLKHFLPLATVWGFVWGLTVIVLRATAGIERKPLLWGLMGLAACLAAALLLALRRMPAATALRALLDEQSGCGGLLMAGAEQDLGGWQQRMPTLQTPTIHWDGRRAGALLAIAIGFVLLCFLAPQGLADLRLGPPLEIDQEIARLVQQIALLKTEAILDPKRAETLAEMIKEIRERTSGKDPARTLEAMDHVKKLASEAAREAAEEVMRRREQFGEARVLAEALRRNADLLDSRLTMEVLSEVAARLDKNGMDAKQLLRGLDLDPELMKSLNAQKLDPEQLKKLAQTLRGKTAELGDRMEKLHKAGLIDAETLARCRKPGECDFEGLRAFLQDNKFKVSLADFKSH